MYLFSRVFGLLAILALSLPILAQDVKKDTPKPGVDKKKDAGKEAKKTTKTKSKSKAKEKEDLPPEEKVVYGQSFGAKLTQMDANSQKDFTVQVMVTDPQKLYAVQVWQQQQMFNIMRQNIRQRPRSLIQFQMQLAQRMAPNNIMSPKDVQLRAAEDIKVRTYSPPTEYDEKGNIKRWTTKELRALKGKSKLPGYPAQYDALRPGQFVQIYLAKQTPALKSAKGPKGLKIEEPIEQDNRPKVVMIMVLQDVAPGQR